MSPNAAQTYRAPEDFSILTGLAHAGACNNSLLTGTYGYQEQGQAPTAGFTQFRSVGELTFDGKGNGKRVSTIWYSDFSIADELPSAVTYEVLSDCRFTFTYANGETFKGVIVANSGKLLYIETTGDPSRSGQAERIRD